MSLSLNTDYEYQVGGSLRIDAPSYVERQADQQLYKALKSGQFCYVLNCRQMGKSSLRVRTMHRLKAEGVRCVAIDMTRLGSEYLTPQQWYERVVSELWRGANLPGKVNLKAWLREHEELALVHLLDRFIEEVLLIHLPGQKIVIFIDEIDSALSLNFSINDFFALIRACYNQRVDNSEYNRLTFCLLGVATPSDLIKDKTRTPFNIGRAISLHGFQFEEAQGLAQGLAGKVSQPDAALREILYWTGGQPFLTQKICQLILENLTASNLEPNPNLKSQIPNPQSIEQLVQTHIIDNWESQDEPEHLRTIRDRVLRNETLASRLLGLYQQILQQGEIASDDSEGQMELRLSGLVVKQGSVLKVYNPIYAAVFNSTWVERTLNNLRPYAQAFNAWITSDFEDESRLLRGQTLEEALKWSAGKSLSSQDAEFLRASQLAENRETKQANEILTKANRTAKWRLRIGAGFLGAALLAAGAIQIWANSSIYYAKTLTQLERESTNALEQFQVQQSEALLSAMRAAYELKKISRKNCIWNQNRWGNVQTKLWWCLPSEKEEATKYPTSSPILALQTILDSIWEQKYTGGNQTILQFSHKGDRILNLSGYLGSPDYTIVTLLDAQGNQLAKFKSPGLPQVAQPSAQLSPDGDRILTATQDGTPRLWDLQGNQLASFKGHQETQGVVRFSPDGRRIITGDDSTARLWDLQGNQLAVFGEWQGGIIDVQFSPDGDRILFVRGHNTRDGYTRTAQLWDSQGNQLAQFDGHQGWIAAVQFSPDGKRIVTGGEDNTARLWDLQGKQLAVFKGHQAVKGYSGGINAVQFSPDGQRIVTGGSDRTARLWNLQGKQLAVFKGHESSVRAVQFSRDGQRIATGGSTTDIGRSGGVGKNGVVRLWNLQGKQLATFWSETGIETIQFSPDGQRIVASDRGTTTTRIWHLQQGNQLTTFVGQQGKVKTVQLSPDGKHVATLGADGTVRLWNRQGKQLATFKRPHGEIEQVRFSPKGDRIFTNRDYGAVRVWDLKGNQLAVLKGGWSLSWKNPISPDGKYTVTRGKGNTIRVWELGGNQIAVTPQVQGSIYALQFSPKGDSIATAGGYGMVRLWNLQGKELVAFKAHPRWVNEIYFTPDGDSEAGRDSVLRIITITSWGPVRLWDLKGNQLATINKGTDFRSDFSVLSPKSGRFVTISSELAYLRDLKGKQLAALQGRQGWFAWSNLPFNPDVVQLSSDGDRIATLGDDGKVRLWDSKGNQIAEYEGYAMALSPDGRQIVAVSNKDNIPRMWQVDDLDEQLKRGCNWMRVSIALSGKNNEDRQMCGIRN